MKLSLRSKPGKTIQSTSSPSIRTSQTFFLGSSWGKKTNAPPLLGFSNDPESVPAARRRTAAQKVTHLELMLGKIANYAPIISRNSIVKNLSSISGVWQTIRLHYGLQLTGSRLDLANISLMPEQRPEDLFQILMAFIEDNLLTTSSGITHHGEIPDVDEELSPSLENFVVLTWLRPLHPSLPRLLSDFSTIPRSLCLSIRTTIYTKHGCGLSQRALLNPSRRAFPQVYGSSLLSRRVRTRRPRRFFVPR